MATTNRYEHQEVAYQKALKNMKRNDGIMLIIDPGLGKTRIAIDVFKTLANTREVDSLLVIYPKGVQTVWVDELQKWHSDKEYVLFMYNSAKKNGVNYRKQFEYTLSTDKVVVYLFNTEAFQVPNNTLEYFMLKIINKKKALVVLDECSYIKNHKAKRTKNILTIAKRYNKKIALTGTEMTKSLLDIYPQFEFVKTGMWNQTFWAFKNRYAVMKKQSFYRSVGGSVRLVEFDEIVGFKNTAEIFNKIEPYSIRIRKENCFELPEKLHIDIPIELDAVASKVYKDVKQNALARITDEEQLEIACTNVFNKLRQITGGFVLDETGKPHVVYTENAKMEYLKADIEGHDKQAIIWAVFRHEVEYIYNELLKIGPAVYFMGNMGDDVRADAVHKFQSGEARFFVANPYACGFGINLQNAYMMYYYSMPTSLEILLQSQDRIHRVGQRNDCVYKYLLAKNTIDNRVMDLNSFKEQLRQAFIHKDISYLEHGV